MELLVILNHLNFKVTKSQRRNTTRKLRQERTDKKITVRVEFAINLRHWMKTFIELISLSMRMLNFYFAPLGLALHSASNGAFTFILSPIFISCKVRGFH